MGVKEVQISLSWAWPSILEALPMSPQNFTEPRKGVSKPLGRKK